VLDPAEQCDDAGASTGCTADCRTLACGDGTVDPGEQCDDGAAASGDGCSAGCVVENDLGSPAESCKALKERVPSAASGAYFIDPAGTPFSVYCDMTSAGGGWTLAMKLDGVRDTLAYDAPYWTDEATLRPEDATLDVGDMKSRAFSELGFTELRLGLKQSGWPRWLTLAHAAPSLLSVFQDADNQPTAAGRAAWRGLVHAASLRAHCDREGFNLTAGTARARIGLLANDTDDCDSSESLVGFGTAGDASFHDPGRSAGNQAGAGARADRDEKHAPAHGFLFVR
jgi:cysteine-rich repeat protein